MYEQEKIYLNVVPKFRFDTSKTLVVTVDDYATIKFEKNYYSVPIKYLRKSVTAKG